jgi:Osmosensitive K+ channel histidine kinase
LLALLSAVVFGGWLEISAKNYPIAFICGPIVIWTAFRFTQRETATGIFILSVIAVWGTVRGFGPFVGQSENQSLLTVQSWTAVLAITAMALSAGMAERRRIEDELQQQKSIVEAANRTKDHFLAMLSHELRTPLTPVISALESLETEPTQTEDTKASMAMIRRNIELETQLIDDLLDFTRITRDKMQLRLAPVDAHQAVSNVVEICRAEARPKNFICISICERRAAMSPPTPRNSSRSFGIYLRTPSNSPLKEETSQSPRTIHRKQFSR